MLVFVWAVAFAFIYGLVIGSFLNVVIYRVPRGESTVSPPSACPQCGTRIRPVDNIPVLSWLLLCGRCRHCGEPISPRYLFVELGTALTFAAITWWALRNGLPADTAGVIALVLGLIALLYLAAISVALGLIDAATRRLPNRILFPAYWVSAILLAATALVAGEPERLLGALGGGAALFSLYFALAIIRPGGMGFGDVKLAGLLGLYLGWFGWPQLIVGAFGAFLLGGLFGLILLAIKRAGRTSSIPFGPWMLAGAWIGILFGDALAYGYLRLYGLA
ncbi:prepilin peptidase [Cryobacterium sp. CG_9.6]|uniref:prepilin peptidase n=1 Tax=Cryobacterium sp. CG_9.6 TaxID=2760710 RepID=UPI00247556E3|nr:prepilin peptidase [Cryobacterium sp. CG_9.6]MDH6238045.1 leader peptidase (prepilin peptidase)/N-methyltransferase [Cryobacterium sp. CG_9.6]